MSQFPSRRAALSMVLSAALLPVAAPAMAQRRKPRVAPATLLVVASLGDLHDVNPNYSYQDLYKIIRDFKPDWVGLEIRPEDVSGDLAWLAGVYPRETVELKAAYGDRVFGFDWLGDDLAGKPLTIGWQDHLPVNALSTEAADAQELHMPVKQTIGANLAGIEAQKRKLLETASARKLNDGSYDALCVEYDNALRQYYEGTRFEAITAFQTSRKARIAATIALFAKAHPGERIAIVTSADHRYAVMDFVKSRPVDVVVKPVTQV